MNPARRPSTLVWLLAAPALASCALSLDFDEIPFGRDATDAIDDARDATDATDDADLDGTLPDAALDTDPLEDTGAEDDTPPSDTVDDARDADTDADTGADAAPDVAPDTDTAPPDTEEPCVPAPEICDGIDNDCDGLIDDEDPDVILGEGDCGRCGVQCGEVEGGTTTCVENICLVDACDEGRRDLNRNADDGCEFSLGESSVFLRLSEAFHVEFVDADAIEVASRWGVGRFNASGARIAAEAWPSVEVIDAHRVGETWIGLSDANEVFEARFLDATWSMRSLGVIDELGGRPLRGAFAVSGHLGLLTDDDQIRMLLDIDGEARDRRTLAAADLGLEPPLVSVRRINEVETAVLTTNALAVARWDELGGTEITAAHDDEEFNFDALHAVERVPGPGGDATRILLVGAPLDGEGSAQVALVATDGGSLELLDRLDLPRAAVSGAVTPDGRGAILALDGDAFVRLPINEATFGELGEERDLPAGATIDSTRADRFCLRSPEGWGCRTDAFSSPFVGVDATWQAGTMAAVGGSQFLAHVGGRELVLFEASAAGIRQRQRISLNGAISRVAATTDGRAFVLLEDLRIQMLVRGGEGWLPNGQLQFNVGTRDNFVDMRISQGFLVFASGVHGAIALQLPESGFPNPDNAIALLAPDEGANVERMTAVAIPGGAGLLAIGVGDGEAWAWPLDDLSQPVRVVYPLSDDGSVPPYEFTTVADVASTRPGRFAVLEPGSTIGLASLDFRIEEDDSITFVAGPFLQSAGAAPPTGEAESRLTARNNFLVRTSPSRGAYVLYDNGIDSLLSALEPETSSGVGLLELPCRPTAAELLEDSRLVFATDCGFVHFNLLTPP